MRDAILKAGRSTWSTALRPEVARSEDALGGTVEGTTSFCRLLWCRTIDVRPKGMTRNATKTLDIEHATRWNTVPLQYRCRGDAEQPS
jgi:hypothetical protein